MRAVSSAPLRVPSRTRLLRNGMQVVFHEDRTAPLVAVHLMLRAGSRDERPGRTGLAHLLEHLLFEGTEHCPKGEFDDLLERSGGSNNGSTWLDRTNYYEIVPTHAAELALWLERERLAHWQAGLTPEMLETQRGVVINERLQSVDNRPYGRADERLHQLLFPAPHPYGWPTIGWVDDLEAITVGDVQAFYRAFYTPANAVLVLAGDLSQTDAWELAERYFGDLPVGAPPPEAPLPFLGEAPERRDVLLDAVSFPRVYRAHAVPPYGTREWVTLDVLAYLLADGESSRLQRALVREGQLAQEIDSWLAPTAWHGVWGWVATAREGVSPERLEAEVERVIREIKHHGPQPAEVDAAVRRIRRDQVAELASLEERAESLAYAATLLGESAALDRVLAMYDTVTAKDVQQAAAVYLRAGYGATVTVLPNGASPGDA